jgi:hypothetical protein
MTDNCDKLGLVEFIVASKTGILTEGAFDLT